MTGKQKNVVIVVAVCLMVLCSGLLVIVKGLNSKIMPNLRNVTDSIMLLAELATESSEDFVQAKADHIEMLGKYIKHMESRRRPLVVAPKNDIVKELKLTLKKLKKSKAGVDQQDEAGLRIEMASKTIVAFLSKHKLFVNVPIVGSESEVISEEIQATIRDLLNEAHKKTQSYINNLSMVNSEVAYRANRKVIVYLYLVRSEWFGLEIDAWKEFRNFNGDINRTIYWNRVLMKRSGITERERSRLAKHSANELRHLRLLRAIMNSNRREAHVRLQVAIKEYFPDIQLSSAEK